MFVFPGLLYFHPIQTPNSTALQAWSSFKMSVSRCDGITLPKRHNTKAITSSTSRGSGRMFVFCLSRKGLSLSTRYQNVFDFHVAWNLLIHELKRFCKSFIELIIRFIFSLNFSIVWIFGSNKHFKSFIYEAFIFVLIKFEVCTLSVAKMEYFKNDIHFRPVIWYTFTSTKMIKKFPKTERDKHLLYRKSTAIALFSTFHTVRYFIQFVGGSS